MKEPESLPVGIHENVSMERYNEIHALRSTLLKELLDGTPAHLKDALDNPEEKDSNALLQGRVLHAMLLEPGKLHDYFVFEDLKLGDKTKLIMNGGSKETWDLMKKDASLRGLPLVPYAIYSRCLGMSRKVKAHPFWSNLDKNGHKELTLIAVINNVRVKARLDVLLGNVLIADLKTCRFRLNKRRIQAAITEFGYHLSAAMYLEIAKALGLPAKRFVWIFIESKSPHLVRYFEASTKMLETGQKEFYELLDKVKACEATDTWEAYPEIVETIDMPDWYDHREILFQRVVNDD